MALTSDTQTQDFSTEWRSLDFANTPVGVQFTVPRGTTAIARLRVTAAVGCRGGDGQRDARRLRCLIDNQPNVTGGGQLLGSDELTGGGNYDQSTSIEAVATAVCPGSHTVRVEWAILNARGGSIFHSIANLVLTVELDRAA